MESDPRRRQINEEKIVSLKEQISIKEQKLSEEKIDSKNTEKINKLTISGNGGIYIDNVLNTNITINKKNISRINKKKK